MDESLTGVYWTTEQEWVAADIPDMVENFKTLQLDYSDFSMVQTWLIKSILILTWDPFYYDVPHLLLVFFNILLMRTPCCHFPRSPGKLALRFIKLPYFLGVIHDTFPYLSSFSVCLSDPLGEAGFSLFIMKASNKEKCDNYNPSHHNTNSADVKRLSTTDITILLWYEPNIKKVHSYTTLFVSQGPQ